MLSRLLRRTKLLAHQPVKVARPLLATSLRQTHQSPPRSFSSFSPTSFTSHGASYISSTHLISSDWQINSKEITCVRSVDDREIRFKGGGFLLDWRDKSPETRTVTVEQTNSRSAADYFDRKDWTEYLFNIVLHGDSAAPEGSFASGRLFLTGVSMISKDAWGQALGRARSGLEADGAI